MAAYDAMYKKLFNATSDAIKILQTAQAEAEEMYISQDEPKITLISPENNREENDHEKQ